MKHYWIKKDTDPDRIIFFTKRPFGKARTRDNGTKVITLKYLKKDTFTMKLSLFERFFNYVPNKDELIYIKIDPRTLFFYGMENNK